MRKLFLAFAALCAFAAPPASAEMTPAKLHKQIDRNLARVHHTLGARCAGQRAAGLQAVCKHGRVTALRGPDRMVWEYKAPGEKKTGLMVRDVLLRPHYRRGGIHTANAYQGCGYTGGKYLYDIVHGLGFHSWQYRVNTGYTANIDWRDGYREPQTHEESLVPFHDASGSRMALEAQQAGQDWMGLRNRWCSSWTEGGDLSGQTANNIASLRIQYVGTTTARASLLPNCMIGDPNTTPNGYGQLDGINAVVSGDWHTTLMADGTRCRDYAVAATQYYVNGTGYTQEADVSINSVYPFCYRFAPAGSGCIDTTFLINHPNVIPMEDVIRHEEGHVIGLDHPCTSCSSKSLMEAEIPIYNSFPTDIDFGSQAYEKFLYVAQ